MVQYGEDGTDFLFKQKLAGMVTILAVHGSRGLAFVRKADGTIATANTGGREYRRGQKVDIFKTGVLF